MKTIINAHVFNKMYDRLLQMSESLEGLGLHLMDVSEDDQVKMPKWATIQMDGISSTLRCLSALCCGMSGELEEWVLWAERENINIDYDITIPKSSQRATT